MEEMILGHGLSVGVAVFLICMMLYGHYRGFLKQCVSIGAFVITLIAVKVVSPYMTDAIMSNTEVRETISSFVLETVGLDEEAESFLGEPSIQRMAIERLEIPESIKTDLIENNNSEVYRMLGVDRFAEYVGAYAARLVLNWVCSIFLFAVIFIILHLLIIWLDLLARLPILYGLNKIAGTFLGLAQGLLLIWIGALFLELFSATEVGSMLYEQVEDSFWLSALYRFNPIAFFLQGLIREIL